MSTNQDAMDEYQHLIDKFEKDARALDDKYGVFMSCNMDCEIIASKYQSSMIMNFWRICGSDISACTGWRTRTPRPTTRRVFRPGEIPRFLAEDQETERVQYSHNVMDLRQRELNKELNQHQFDTHVDGWGKDWVV